MGKKYAVRTLLLPLLWPALLLGLVMVMDARPALARERVESLKALAERESSPEAVRKETAKLARKGVLLMFPYQIDLPASVLSERAIREEFDKVPDLAFDLYFEYLDLNRFPGDDNRRHLFDLYAGKYRKKQIDLVIMPTEAVLSLWLAERGRIAPKAPVVVFDIHPERLARLRVPPEVTGVGAVTDYVPSVKWILGIRPSVREVVVVHGVGKAEQEYAAAVEAVKKELGGTVKFTDLSGLPLKEIRKRVASLPQSAVVLYHLMFEDGAGIKYRPIDVAHQLSSASTVPVISGYDQYIGTGVVGGYMYSMAEEAREAATMGVRILRGEPVGTVTMSKSWKGRFVFDFPALKRFGIHLSDLPPGSMVKNRRYTLWDRYRPHIIATAVILGILLILVAFLLVLTRKLNKARIALSRLNASLEAQVEERTSTLREANQRLEREILEREHAEEALRAGEQEFKQLAYELEVIIDSFPGPIFYKDKENRVQRVNRYLADSFNVPKDRLEGKNILDIYPKGLPPAWRDEDGEVMRDGRAKLNIEEMLVTPEGARWALTSKIPFLDRSGDVAGVTYISQDITERKKAEEERERLISELTEALSQVKTLTGLLPICASCKRIRNDGGEWEQMEVYVREHSEADFSHGICPECMKRLYPEYCDPK